MKIIGTIYRSVVHSFYYCAASVFLEIDRFVTRRKHDSIPFCSTGKFLDAQGTPL